MKYKKITKKIKLEYIILTIILIGFLALRIGLAYSVDNPNYSSYFTMRQVDSILHTGRPFYIDEMNGNLRLEFSPFYYYIISAFSLLSGIENAIKILPNLLFVLSIFLIFFVSKKLTNNSIASIIAAFFTASTPILLSSFVNSISEILFLIPLFILTFYYFFTLSQNTKKAMFMMIFSILLSPLSIILILGLVIYVIVLKLEKIKIEEEYKDLLFFSIPFYLWYYAITYNKAFFNEGIKVLWMNLPSSLLSNYFSEFSIITASYSVGALTLLFAVYTMYSALFIRKSRHIILLTSLTLSTLLLLLLKFVKLRSGLIILTIFFILLAAYSIKLTLIYLEKTKFSFIRYFLIFFIVLFFIFSSLLPGIAEAEKSILNSPSKEDMKAVEWLKNNTQNESIILTTIYEADFINYAANRATISNENFLLRKNANILVEDINIMYKSMFIIPLIEKMDKYSVEYIYYSKNTRKIYNQPDLKVESKECFEKNIIEDIIIYKKICSVER